jgi:hypothetical protein
MLEGVRGDVYHNGDGVVTIAYGVEGRVELDAGSSGSIETAVSGRFTQPTGGANCGTTTKLALNSEGDSRVSDNYDLTTGDILPDDDSTYEIGAIGKHWKTIYADTIAADAVNCLNDLTISAVGAGVVIKEGVNARMGVTVLVAGTKEVANTSVTANTRIFLTSNVDGGTPGWLRVSARTAGVSFTITSSDGSDTSTVAWLLLEPSS